MPHPCLQRVSSLLRRQTIKNVIVDVVQELATSEQKPHTAGGWCTLGRYHRDYVLGEVTLLGERRLHVEV